MELKDNDNITHEKEEHKETAESEREEATVDFAQEEGVENVDDFEDDEEKKIEDEMEKLYEQSFVEVEEGTILRGKIVGLSGGYALVDVGYKSEGVVPLDEFSDPNSINIGDEIDVYLVSAEDQDGMVVLSKKRADRIRNWQQVLSAYEKGEPVEGRIKSRIKGGFLVDIGLEAFLPMSHLSIKPVDNPDEFVGQKLQFKIIKVNRRRRNVVVSRKLFMEEERQKQREKTLSEIQVGQLREGVVKKITDFGAFIDLGGVDGLLHITDMSWGRVSHPSQILSEGDKIEVMVLDFDPERMRISLGLKQKTPDPWLAVDEKYPVGAKVKGRVVSITDYGAFVELEPGVEGLVHVSEMSWVKRVRHPSEVVKVGDEVEVMVLALDKNARKMSLGIKQVEPNPWEIVRDKYPPGTKVKGVVKTLTDYGAFITLPEGVDGLLHISDMSWTGDITHPSQILRVGQEVEVVVLNVDAYNRRIALGLKQVEPDPWEKVAEKYSPGQYVEGTVTKIVSFGAFVELEEGVEGLIHLSQLARKRVEKPEEAVSIGQKVKAKIVRFDPVNRKLGLSVKEYLKDMEEMAKEEYKKKLEEESKITLGDIVKDELEKVKDLNISPEEEEKEEE